LSVVRLASSRYDGIMDQLIKIHEILEDAVRRGELWAYSDLAEVEALLVEQKNVFELMTRSHQKRRDPEAISDQVLKAFIEGMASPRKPALSSPKQK
jgi:hypothetical protein